MHEKCKSESVSLQNEFGFFPFSFLSWENDGQQLQEDMQNDPSAPG